MSFPADPLPLTAGKLSRASGAKVARCLQILLIVLAGFLVLSLAEMQGILTADHGRQLLLGARLGLLASMLLLTYRAQGPYWCFLYGLAALLPVGLPISAALAVNAAAFRLKKSNRWPGWLGILTGRTIRLHDAPP